MRLNYAESVNTGKELLGNIKDLRYKIAKLAIDVCTIKRGGHGGGNIYSLSMYAQDIGMTRSNLSNWVNEYKRVYLSIKKQHRKKIDPAIAARVDRIVAKRKLNHNTEEEKEAIRQIYHSESTMTVEGRNIQEMRVRMRHFSGMICHEYVLSRLSKPDLMSIKDSSHSIDTMIRDLLSISTQSKQMVDKIKSEMNYE